MDTSPSGIRALRGERSVKDFALLLGVTPLTIYRWELPESAAESRRPRKGSRARLRALVDQPAAPLLPAAAASLETLDELMASASWEAAREQALDSVARGEPGAPQLLLVAAAVLGRGDARAALALMAPVLQAMRAGRAPAVLKVRACAMAALVWATPDGRTFSPSRVREASAMAVEHAAVAPDYAALAVVAELQAAWLGADAAVFEWTFAHRGALLDGARAPVVAALVAEMRATRAYIDGRPGEAHRWFSLAVQQAEKLGFGLLEARGRSMLALLDLESATPPARVLALTRRAREAREAARLAVGHIDILIAAVEAEALMRRGLASEASAVCYQADRVADEIRWLPVETLLCRTRMTYDTEGEAGIRRLREWFEARADWLPAPEAPLHFVRGLDTSFQTDFDASLVEYRAAADKADWCRPGLKRMARLLVFGAAAYLRPDQAEAASVGMERCLERSPSAWFRGLTTHLKGLVAAQVGDHRLAEELLQTALSTLEMAGDTYESVRCRRALALAAWLRHAPDASEKLRASDEEMAALGITPSPGQRTEYIKRLERVTQQSEPRPPLPLIVPVQRLSMRGLSTEQLCREFLGMARELSGAVVALSVVGPPERLIARLGTPSEPVGFSLEIADGVGGRYRLDVSGRPDDETRSLLRALSAVAGMSLERAALYEAVPASDAPAPPPAPAGFIAEAPASKGLLADLGRLSKSRATVLITGESGVGKEVAAHALHTLSARAGGPFVAFNCAAVPRELFDAQLFGYRRGAFTGARDSRTGTIRAADGGTLFLDEVGELPLAVQAKLLRFLENREVQPLGADLPVKVDVRVVAATHRDLRAMVEAGRFREDLLYRLRVVPLRLPPLRERREDILPLARHFLQQLSGGRVRLAPDAAARLSGHPWPGNVRELRNALERATAYTAEGVLTAGELQLDAW